VPGDTLFALGALVLGWFVLGLRTGWSLQPGTAVAPGSTEVREPPPGAKPERA
jgi:nitric oxide reductase subunit B